MSFKKCPCAMTLAIFCVYNIYAGESYAEVTDTDNKQNVHLLTELNGTSKKEVKTSGNGFYDGSQLTFKERFYFRNLSHNHPELSYSKISSNGDIEHFKKDFLRASILSTILSFKSGYTPGPVGFGINMALMNGISLYTAHNKVPDDSDITLSKDDGNPYASWSRIGEANVKIKTLFGRVKMGRQIMNIPLLHSNDNRALPASFYGSTFESRKWYGVTLKFGTVSKTLGRVSTGQSAISLSYAPSVKTKRVNYIGFDYHGMGDTTLHIYTSQIENIMWQSLIEGEHSFYAINTVKLTPRFSFYKNTPTGEKLAGSQPVSLAVLGLSAEYKIDKLSFNIQQVFGNVFFDYINETNSIYYSNTAYSDYQSPHERSVDIIYEHDFGNNFPGLSLIFWGINGWGINTSQSKSIVYNGNYGDDTKDARHYEIGISPKYIFQSGYIKGLSLRLGFVSHHQTGGQITGSGNEFLLVGEWPFQF